MGAKFVVCIFHKSKTWLYILDFIFTNGPVPPTIHLIYILCQGARAGAAGMAKAIPLFGPNKVNLQAKPYYMYQRKYLFNFLKFSFRLLKLPNNYHSSFPPFHSDITKHHMTVQFTEIVQTSPYLAVRGRFLWDAASSLSPGHVQLVLLRIINYVTLPVPPNTVETHYSKSQGTLQILHYVRN